MEVLQIIGAAIGIITFLGVAAVFLGGSKDKGRIEALEANVNIYKERAEALKDQVTELKTTVAAQGARIGALERENEELKAQRPSAEAIEAMTELLQSHDETTQAKLSNIVSLVGGGKR